MDEKSSEMRILLGGPQGTGLETASQILAAAYAIGGYRVYSMREYFSNIKGRHSYIGLRVNPEKQPLAPIEGPHIVAGIDAETIFTHFTEAIQDTIIIYDTRVFKTKLRSIASMEKYFRDRVRETLEKSNYDTTVEGALRYASEELGAKSIGLDYQAILNDFSQEIGISKYQAQRYLNTILVATIANITGLSLDELKRGFKRRFGSKVEIIEDNMKLSAIVYKFTADLKDKIKIPTPHHSPDEYLVVNGNEVVAMGKIVGGLRFQSYYPITPASDESFMLETHENLENYVDKSGGIVVLQTEDEIAAISAAIGSALTGARSATATSGPGFDLMVEALGWAGINEVPVVITYYQRGGPSTGLPTRGGQQDLFSALFSSHGEFPRIVISSGDHEEAFYDAITAINWAEKYQTPVIHILDKFLANTTITLELPHLEKIAIERGDLLQAPPPNYKRFKKNGSPIAPRVVLGAENAVIWYAGDEHDEEGHIIEDPINRLEMHELRMKKLEIAHQEIPQEERAVLYGSGEDFLLVGWGSTKGVALEAIELLKREGYKGAYLHLRVFEPFPKEYVAKILSRYKPEKIIAVESNYESMAAKVITMNTGFIFKKHILKWTGRPIYVKELSLATLRILEGLSSREVLSYGA
ncbi:MAG: 2-oxoacid:acceptor oxidoreductase subunit alpha [Caldisphaeraceae archaeon]|nr:2-oxoacid:acceptor oxidoreductase subunit alpha [Caldisphaeraceae archaeon]